MGFEEDFNNTILNNLTPSEEQVLSGYKRREFFEFVSDVATAGEIKTGHMSYFQRLIGEFSSASAFHSLQRLDDIHFENEHQEEDSLFMNLALGLTREIHHGKELLALNIFGSSANSIGFFAAARPYPVKWHIDHLQERSVQRGNSPLETSDMLFLKHNAVALAMLRIIEEERPEAPDVWHPFILPERNGILLGHTMHALPGHSSNRFSISATPDIERFQNNMGQYERRPTLNMTVRTFYGPEEMTPAMKALRLKLLPFYASSKGNALLLELEGYGSIKDSPSMTEDPRYDDYCDALIDLSDLMSGQLWQKNVILPLHLRQPMIRDLRNSNEFG